MTDKEKFYEFHKFLRLHGIGEFSPYIPEGIGNHLNGVPFEEDLVKVPKIETFPLPEIEKQGNIKNSDMVRMFTQAQIEGSIFEPEEEEEKREPIQRIPTIDTEVQYTSGDQFISFKKEMNAYLVDKSKSMNTEIHCCMKVNCLNPTVPGFDYCINHLQEDPKFKEQKILAICKKEGCNAICDAHIGYCPKHNKANKKK